jgi:hypothetical protein
MPEVARKADAARIVAHLDALAASDWIGTARKWWPKYVFHFAELRNAVSILESGELIARSLGPMSVDTASPSVIAHTDDEWRRHVRFYFRPRTPTQYQCEGFRPTNRYGSAGAHSPMPFVFLFDSREVLTRATTRFSNGNLGKYGVTAGDTAEFFEQLPFPEIYHDSAFTPENRDLIVNRRHAEVIVPERIDLSPLRLIACRSAAEYQTLINSLNPQALNRYLPKIAAQGHGALHHRRWTFVDDVTLEYNRVLIRFNPSTATPGPFAAKIAIRSTTAGELQWNDSAFNATGPFTLNIPQHTTPTSYQIELTLDGNRAYLGRFTASETAIPNPPLF